jgi:hypothetical protein
MVRANTIEMQGKPGLMGDVGGMYLAIMTSDLSLWGHPGPGRLTLPLSVLAYEDQSTHRGVTLRLSLGE